MKGLWTRITPQLDRMIDNVATLKERLDPQIGLNRVQKSSKIERTRIRMIILLFVSFCLLAFHTFYLRLHVRHAVHIVRASGL